MSGFSDTVEPEPEIKVAHFLDDTGAAVPVSSDNPLPVTLIVEETP